MPRSNEPLNFDVVKNVASCYVLFVNFLSLLRDMNELLLKTKVRVYVAIDLVAF